jgi:D-3-phosphoglycerate dehydrogenase
MIARCLCRKITGLNFSEILVYDPYVDEKTISGQGAKKADWETAIKNADYISIHMPLNDKTRGIINSKTFAMMKTTAILINTSRGPVIDEDALIKALRKGQINSAGLDVHVKEPLDPDSPLMSIKNCVLTDHVGWYSEESLVDLKRKAAENVRDVLKGEKPAYPVNRL